MEPQNPFIISGYVSPVYFCDRKKESGQIYDSLKNGRNITLVAPRRMGKTGLIKNVFYNLKKEDKEIITLYIDIYSTQNLREFVALMADIVLGSLDTSTEKTINRISRYLKSCRPVFTIDEVTGLPKVTVSIAPEAEIKTLKEIFDYLGSSEKRCYIAIDEFQQITQYPEKGVEALLRSYIQFLPNINWIFSGSKEHIMREMFLSLKRPFYQSTQLLSIGGIDKNEYYKFAENFFRKQKRTIDENIFFGIYDEFEGHTWYIQSILNRLYGFNVNPDHITLQTAISEILAEMEYSYQSLLTSMSPTSSTLLKAIAKSKKVKSINSGEFIHSNNLKAASSVNRAIKPLIDRELVYKSIDGYMVYDRFMAIWLRNQPF